MMGPSLPFLPARPPTNPCQIANINDLLTLADDTNNYDKAFILINDIDLASLTFSSAVIARDINSSVNNFEGTSFTGIFDGDGHSIKNLTINTEDCKKAFLGLFGRIYPGGIVKNLGIEGINIYETNGDNISGSFVGGLCGSISDGIISNCYSTGSISGDYMEVGGLSGENSRSTITDSFSTAEIRGKDQTGGLAGLSYNCTISNCYSSGNVNGFRSTGGLCGCVEINTNIINCYSMGQVTGQHETGGFVGDHEDGNISNCYSIGLVNGGDFTGGFCGVSFGTISSCYFLDTAGPDNGFGTPLSDVQMRQQASFQGWDFSYNDGDEADWFMQIDEYPILTWQISPADLWTDGRNNFKDFAIFAQYWMREDCAIYNYYCDGADLNFDGTVDIDDLIELISYWLETGIYD